MHHRQTTHTSAGGEAVMTRRNMQVTSPGMQLRKMDDGCTRRMEHDSKEKEREKYE